MDSQNIKKGLNEKEVLDSREKFGSNELTQIQSQSFLSKLWETLTGDPIIKVLLVALVLNVIFFFLGESEWYESVGIAVAVALATIIATWSEHSGEETFKKLQEDASKIKVKVYRNGGVLEISIDEVVKGDLVLLQSGDKIPADGILLEGELKVDQASLNGETKEAKKRIAPVNYEIPKDIDFLDEYQVFRGSVVCSGEALMQVVSVGDTSIFGQLAKEMQTEDRDSPLKVKLNKLAGDISKVGYTAGVLIALAHLTNKILIANKFDLVLISEYFSNWQTFASDLVAAIIVAIIIIVVAVPEGLPMMVAMVLSLNMRKLLKDNILVRKLVGIETAGSLNILFSDKTGTITKGELEVVEFITGDKKSFSSIDSIPDTKIKSVLKQSLINNTSSYVSVCESNKTEVLGGNATEKALLKFAISSESDNEVEKLDVIRSIPFNSDNKYSATEIKTSDDSSISLIKGASEKILENCDFYYGENGDTIKLDSKDELFKVIDDLASRAIRVLAIATSETPCDDNFTLNKMTLVGLVGIRDDIREESITAIKQAQDAGIQVVMITGDNKETAMAIAKESGLIRTSSDIALTSSELKDISDEQLKEMLPNIRVVSRALPTDKSRLVRVSQELDLVVGMTGDGVNDAPALKLADVGFAMGSGTEVAKEAGDIVILDDNFKSITKTVLYGRTIFNNIRKFLTFQLTINLGALAISLIGPFIGIEEPLKLTQMLWINLLMDTLAAIAFGGEPAIEEYMSEKPKSRSESILSSNMMSSIASNGFIILILSIFFLKSDVVPQFFRSGPTDNPNMHIMTGFFAFFIIVNAINAFNTRTESLSLFKNIGNSFALIMGLVALVQVALTHLGGHIFRAYGLSIQEWLFVLGLSLVVIPFDLLRKKRLLYYAKQNVELEKKLNDKLDIVN